MATRAPADWAEASPTGWASDAARESAAGGRVRLTTVIGRTLRTASGRDEARNGLIGYLILAQLLLTVAIGVGYIGVPADFGLLLAVAATVADYALAWLVNRVQRNARLSAYLLIYGGALGIAAQIAIAAQSGRVSETGQASLFFVAIILEAGLLVAPEVVLITAGACATVTGAGVLLALALGPSLDRHATYLVVVSTLMLQALVGWLAWLLAQYIAESTFEAQRGQEMQFAQARLDALMSQQATHQSQLVESLVAMQRVITRAITGEYSGRIEPPENELRDLAHSLNLLLQRIQVADQSERDRERMEGAMVPLIAQMGRLADPQTPTPASVAILTNTPMDGISLAVNHLQMTIGQRLAHLQRLGAEVAAAAGHSREGLRNIAEEVLKAQAITGKLRSAAEVMLRDAQRQLDVVAQAQRAVSGLAPTASGLTPAHATEGQPRAQANDDLSGLGADLGILERGHTDVFETLPPEATPPTPRYTVPLRTLGDEHVVSGALTEPVAAAGAAEAPRAGEGESAAAHATAATTTAPTLAEVWQALASITQTLEQQERGLSSLPVELGMLTGSIRQADAGVAWMRQALETVRADADQIQQIAGAPSSGTSTQEPGAEPSADLARRGPQRSRPLAGEALPESGSPATAGEQPRVDDLAPGALRASDLVNLEGLGPQER